VSVIDKPPSISIVIKSSIGLLMPANSTTSIPFGVMTSSPCRMSSIGLSPLGVAIIVPAGKQAWLFSSFGLSL
jgi:hypothetical protein